MFHNYGYEVTTILKNAEKIRYQCKHPYVGTEHLLLSILNEENEVTKIFKDYQVTYETFKKELLNVVGKATRTQELNLYTPMLKRVIEIAQINANENNKGLVTPTHLVLAMLEEGEGVAIRILYNMDIPLDNIYDSLKVKNMSKEKRHKNLEVMKIGIPLSQNINKDNVIVGREKELSLMIETLLRRQKNNPLLIGKAGVGKTALVEELARRIKYHEVPEELKDMEIVCLEMGSLVAGTKYRGEFEEKLNKIIKEVISEKNIILFIDEIHSMVNAGGAEGAISASDILKPYLARGSIKVIGATTLEEYHEFLEKDKALDRRFERIIIEEPTKEEMKSILTKITPTYESHYDLTITEENIDDIIELSEEYLFQKNNPDKSIDLLDSVCARIKRKNMHQDHKSAEQELEKIYKRKEKYIRNQNYKKAMEEKTLEENIKHQLQTVSNSPKLKMTKDDILEMIESKTNTKIRQNKKELLNSLETTLKKEILGQDIAINKMIDTLKMPNQKGTSFLLVGGSGVGKTETAKIVSKVLKMELIRLDMSEYATPESINKLIGTPAGYIGYNDSYVFQRLTEHPFAVILLDEIEKAHREVLNLLLQILDESYIMDRKGNKIHFEHTLIFMTSNIEGRKKVGFSTKTKPAFEGILSKELLGRIKAVVEYAPITKEVAKEYIKRHIKLEDTEVVSLIEEAEIEKFGLRNLKFLIQKQKQEKTLIENT